MTTIAFRSQLEIASGYIDPTEKPTSVAGCTYTFANSTTTTTTTTTPSTPTDDNEPSPSNNQLNLYYYSLLGLTICIIVAHISSLFCKQNYSEEEENVDPKLLAPFIRKYYNKGKNISTAEKTVILHTFEKVNQKVAQDSAEE